MIFVIWFYLYTFFAVDVRKLLHLRLGLPLDRPLLRIANALDLSVNDDSKSNMKRRGRFACFLNFLSVSQYLPWF